MTTEDRVRITNKLWMLAFSDEDIRNIRESIIKADINRWHDLREDPYDLPCILQEVIVCALTESGNKKYFSTCYVKDGFLAGGYQVIAWKEIEPFEEEK